MTNITYSQLLKLFIVGENIDETTFYFRDDPTEEEHYIGYLPEYEKPYWAGYCDVIDGCKDRYDNLVLIAIGGINIDDWVKYTISDIDSVQNKERFSSEN